MNRRRRATALGALLAVVVMVVGGCRDDKIQQGQGRLSVDGRADVTRADGDVDHVSSSTRVGRGDLIRLVRGRGTLALAGSLVLELRAGLDGAEPSAVRVDTTPELVAGEVLLTTEDPATIDAAGTTVTLDSGAAKVSREFGMSVTSYRGGATIDSAGQTRSLSALRRIEVAVLGSPPADTPPLTYQAGDPWDRRFLGDAMALGERFESFAFTLTASLGGGSRFDAAFLRRVIRGLDDEPAFTDSLIDSARPAGDTIVGASIVALGRKGAFPDRWNAVFSFRDEGAAWGLVLLDQAVSQGPAATSIGNTVRESEVALSETTTTTRAEGTAPTAPPTSNPGTGPTTTTPPTTPPTTEPPVVDLPEPLDPAEDILTGLIDALLP